MVGKCVARPQKYKYLLGKLHSLVYLRPLVRGLKSIWLQVFISILQEYTGFYTVCLYMMSCIMYASAWLGWKPAATPAICGHTYIKRILQQSVAYVKLFTLSFTTVSVLSGYVLSTFKQGIAFVLAWSHICTNFWVSYYLLHCSIVENLDNT